MRMRLVAAGVCAWALAAAPGAGADLATYGYGNARLGTAPAGSGIAAAAVPGLRVAWRRSLPGAINAQPLVANRVRVGRSRRDLVFAATEHGWIAALDGASGRVVWRRHVGTARRTAGCQGSPDGILGVTGTMVLDRRTSHLYAVDVDGRAWALSLANGRVARGWPVRVHPAGADFVWSALTLSRGRLYVPVASLCDAGHYRGGVVSVDVAHPHKQRHWYTTAGTPAYAGGIWGWGGVSVDARDGDVYEATGNSLGTIPEDTGLSERVVRLSAGLSVKASNNPLSGSTYAIGDRDFGTTPVLIDAPGCPPQLVAINKVGELYLYARDAIAAGPEQRLAVAADSENGIPLYGMPAYDPASRTLVLVSPTDPPGGVLHAGVQAFTLAADCRLALLWQAAFDAPDAGGPPTIADGVVYAGSGRNGRVLAYRLSDGRQILARQVSGQATFAAPAVADGTLFVADWSGTVTALR